MRSSVCVGCSDGLGVGVSVASREPQEASQYQRALGPDRLRIITDLVRTHGSVKVHELMQLFGVTDETVRRDLVKLEELGVLARAYGGAVSASELERPFSTRLVEREVEKTAIAKAALSLIRDGMRIILDSGTTTLCLARMLRGQHDLVVATNAVTNASELIGVPGVTVVSTGGIIRPSTFGAVGDFAVATLRQLHVDTTFLAIHSVSAAAGLTYPEFEEVAVKQAMIDAGHRVVLLADGSKFGREALVRVAPLDVLDTIITAGQIDPHELAAITQMGIEVIRADELHAADSVGLTEPDQF